MRSPRELSFRLWQQVANVAMWAVPPRRPRREPAFLDEYAAIVRRFLPPELDVAALAGRILEHRFPIFAEVFETGPSIHWRRDPKTGVESGLDYFRFIPYLDAARAGDHKLIWELNRHQHLVILALAGEPRHVAEIAAQLDSWRAQNPFLRGINWASALEVAFRALSWLAVLALVPDLPGRDALLDDLWRHGRYLEHNLSTYFSPNTHLLGEALALFTLGKILGHDSWQRTGSEILDAQTTVQIFPDGAYFEQSTYYHVYALDMYLLYGFLTGRHQDLIGRMAKFLTAILGPARKLPFLGDDDGGRLFFPYGERDEFGRHTLSLCAPPTIRPVELFPDTGLAVLTAGSSHIVIDCGPFGRGGAGHSHSDALSVVWREGGREILIDPGTYSYTGDPVARDRFRGSGAHSTIRIDRLDQADPLNPFRWENKPEVRLFENPLAGECTARGITHRREFSYQGGVLEVRDSITGQGRHHIEQLWQLPAPEAHIQIEGAGRIETIPSERSRCYGRKEPSWILRATVDGELPVQLIARISC